MTSLLQIVERISADVAAAERLAGALPIAGYVFELRLAANNLRDQLRELEGRAQREG